MLTRLKVSGFKNLIDVDISFGPFTCIAGPNGAGKSNLFDAIKFLSNLTDGTLIDAARSVRDEKGRTTDVKSLFYQAEDYFKNTMSFEAEMIIPSEGVDDLGQKAEAGITFLRYSLDLHLKKEDDSNLPNSLEITREKLDHIKIGSASKHLRFPHSYQNWRREVVRGRRTSPFISTSKQGDTTIVKLHQEGAGMPRPYPAKTLPRTVLSSANTNEHPTALLARREMRSWFIQQLEPSALRDPDRFDAPTKLGHDGKHLAANLYHLARANKDRKNSRQPDSWIYDQVASRLSELINDVSAAMVDRDEKRELLTLIVRDRYGTELPARSLSDGTLRFLALTILELDPKAGGLICLEEPENGIHPERVPAMIQLLQDVAMEVHEPVAEDNPLRQVIINTHSPLVVSQVHEDSLIVAELNEVILNEHGYKRACFRWLPDTWRHKAFPEIHPVAKGKVLALLSPIVIDEEKKKKNKPRRVIDREDLAPYLPFMNEE
jgi:predicted ATPase